jgi:hypothetical protein
LAEFFDWDPVERRTDTELAFARAIEGSIPPDTLELLESLANHPRTMLLQRLGRAVEFDLWTTSNTEGNSESALLLRPLAVTVAEAARANVLAAVFEAARGDLNLATRRLGENAAIGEHFLRAPNVPANRLAMNFLSNQALHPLAALERARGDAERAAELDRAAQQVRIDRRLGNAAGLTSDPADFDRFAAAVTNTRVPAGYRASWLRQGWAGLCAHPREILLGPSRERRTEMQAVLNSMVEIPLIEEHAESYEAAWRWPATSMRTDARESAGDVRLEDKLFLGPLLRVFACANPDNPT